MSALDDLAKACGEESVRPGEQVDAVDGVAARYVISAHDQDAVARAIRVCAEHRLTVGVRGTGSKLDWGKPPSSVDVLVDLSAMDAVLEHAAGDLIVRVQPGIRLAALQEVLARAGQRLAIDDVVPGSTAGGIVATGLAGPLRYSYGAVRDLLIGVTVVRPDGVAARSGGKVVKNVAGYDLGKLYTGSYGTLGIITEAIFRLHPVPERARYIHATFGTAVSAAPAVAAVVGSQLAVSAIEVDRAHPGGPVTTCVLVEGSAPGVAARAERVCQLLGAGAEITDRAPSWWGVLGDGALVRMTSQLTGVTALLDAAEQASAETGVPVGVRGSAGAGVLHAFFPWTANAAAAAQLIDQLRAACTKQGGFAVLLHAPRQLKAIVDVWGPVPGISVMRRIKDGFDPEHRFAPGRFVGGI